MNAGANLTLSEITCLHRQKCLFVFLFVFQVGKESGANVICRRRRNRRSTGRGEGKIGATLGERGGDRTKYQELTGPYTYRPCCTGRRTFISCHTKVNTLWIWLAFGWPGESARGKSRKTTSPQFAEINFATDIAPPANDRHGLSQ